MPRRSVIFGPSGMSPNQLMVGESDILDAGSTGNAAPAVPTGLAVVPDTIVHPDGHHTVEAIFSWNPVALDVDGQPEEVEFYEVAWKGTPSGTWGAASPVDASITTVYLTGFVLGQHIDFRVRAVDIGGKRSLWSSLLDQTMSGDAAGPAQPSTPSASPKLAAVEVSWNGLNSSAGAMDADFDHVDVHLVGTATALPDTTTFTTRYASMVSAGKVLIGLSTYTTPYWARLVAYDRLGNPSALPSGASISVTPISPADATVPNPPTTLLVSPTPYTGPDGTPFVEADLSWTAPTLNTDGSTITDLEGYYVSWKISSSGTWAPEQLVPAGTTTAFLRGFLLGTTADFRVRARDKSGNYSLTYATANNQNLGSDTTGPGAPSTPTTVSMFGALRVTWDGKKPGGTAMEADFDHVDVHVGPSGFTPGPTTLVDKLYGAGSSVVLSNDYVTLKFAVLVPYDRYGNPGTASAASTPGIAPRQGVDADFQNVSVTKLTAGKVSFDMGLAQRFILGNLDANGRLVGGTYDGSGNLTSATGVAHMEIGSQKIRAFSTTAETVTIDGSDGSIKAYKGEIGQWQIGTTILKGGTGVNSVTLDPNNGIWLGNDTQSLAPFSVTRAGALTAKSGSIGDWQINTINNDLRNAGGTVILSPTTGITGASYQTTAGLVLAGSTAGWKINSSPSNTITAYSGAGVDEKAVGSIVVDKEVSTGANRGYVQIKPPKTNTATNAQPVFSMYSRDAGGITTGATIELLAKAINMDLDPAGAATNTTLGNIIVNNAATFNGNIDHWSGTAAFHTSLVATNTFQAQSGVQANTYNKWGGSAGGNFDIGDGTSVTLRVNPNNVNSSFVVEQSSQTKPFIRPVSTGPDSGLRFGASAIAVRNNADGAYVPILASAFTVNSSKTVKTNLKQHNTADLLAVVRKAPSYSWHYRDELEWTRYDRDRFDAAGNRLDPVVIEVVNKNSDARWKTGHLHHGPMAEDLPVEFLAAPDEQGVPSTDLRDLIGVLWGAVSELSTQIDGLKAKAA